MADKSKKTFSKKKLILTIVPLALVLLVAVGVTVAYLVDKANPVENVFEPGYVTTEVNETFVNNQKTDVTIKNTGNVDAYIRAAVVINWKDSDGNILAAVPDGGSYTVTGAYNTTASGSTIPDTWFKGSDDYYYYTSRVAPGGNTTGNLIDEATATIPEGYQLSIEILSSGVQADGVDNEGKMPVVLEWGVTVTGDLVSGKSN